jgi:hypothetical protein
MMWIKQLRLPATHLRVAQPHRKARKIGPHVIHPYQVGFVLMLLASPPATAQVPLSADTFRQSGSDKGMVILQVNWGRYWKCGPYENAQLQRLAFRRITGNNDSPARGDWELSPSSSLIAKPSFEPYVMLLEPGQYALSGFKFKVAVSPSSVKVVEVDSSKLIVSGKPVGGSFNVAAGEAVYIGHFGVDCHGEPTPWRFYIEGKDEFDRYVDGFHKHFPFAKDAVVTYRLFQTEQFGQPYDLSR